MTCSHGREIEYCQQCLENGDRLVAAMSPFQHLTDAARSFFYFRFFHVIVDLVWAFQKLTKTGEFGPNGYFTLKGYMKNDSKGPDL